MKKQGILTKITTFILTLAFFTSIATTTTFAQQPITVTIDGVQVHFENTQPQIIDGRTLVPARGVFEHLGFDVNWEPETRNVTLVRPGQFVRLVIDQATFTLNGSQTFQLDVPATIINGSTMLPLRAVIEAIGYQLSWDGPTQTVIIVTDDLFNFVSDDEPQATNPTNVAPVTITRNGTTVVRADETGVHILSRILLTQEEIQSLLPLARAAEETRMSPHPNRAMTAQELVAWNEEYDRLGGMNRQELEVLYRHNEIRAEHNLQLFAVCPALNRAARLQTNLMVDHSFFAHDDPFYGRPTDRALLFDAALANRVRPFVSENATMASTSERAMTNWMNSSGHRDQILNASINFIGVGNTDARTATKFNAQ